VFSTGLAFTADNTRLTPIKTTICALAQKPGEFSGKFVQVRGKHHSSMETSGLSDAGCYLSFAISTDTYLSDTQPGDIYAFMPMIRDPKNPYQLIWDPKVRRPKDWTPEGGLKWQMAVPPAPVVPVEDEAYRRFFDFGARKYRSGDRICWVCPLFEVVATVTGRFDYSETPLVALRPKQTGKIVYRPAGFGHLNGALRQLVLRSISEVAVTPIDAHKYTGR
jgi:hypothetical protein